MVTGATGDDVHAFDLGENPRRVSSKGRLQDPVVADAFAQGVGHRHGLLVDFLEHEMTELATLCRVIAQLAFPDRPLDLAPLRIEDGY